MGAVISGIATVAPILGGWLTSAFAWQWIFIVNIPLGVAVLIGAVLFVTQTRSPGDDSGFDVVGLLLGGAGFGLFVFALIEGPTLGWWSAKSTLIVGPMTWPGNPTISMVPLVSAASIVLLGGFMLWEKPRAKVNRSAILDLTCSGSGHFHGKLRGSNGGDRRIWASAGVAPVFDQYSGFRNAQRWLCSGHHGPGRVFLGLVKTATTSVWLISVLLVVYGLGLGLASAQLTGTVLADIPTAFSGQGSATPSIVRQLGAALGSAIMGSVLAHYAVSNATSLLTAVPGLPATQVGTLAGQLRDSAGGVVPQLTQLGAHGPLGNAGPAAVDALSSGFAQAASASVLAAAVFLFIGLVGSFRVAAAAPKMAAEAS